jgi:hypothetical protein
VAKTVAKKVAKKVAESPTAVDRVRERGKLFFVVQDGWRAAGRGTAGQQSPCKYSRQWVAGGRGRCSGETSANRIWPTGVVISRGMRRRRGARMPRKKKSPRRKVAGAVCVCVCVRARAEGGSKEFADVGCRDGGGGGGRGGGGGSRRSGVERGKRAWEEEEAKARGRPAAQVCEVGGGGAWPSEKGLSPPSRPPTRPSTDAPSHQPTIPRSVALYKSVSISLARTVPAGLSRTEARTGRAALSLSLAPFHLGTEGRLGHAAGDEPAAATLSLGTALAEHAGT